MKNLDINNLVRSAIIGGVILPVTFSMAGLFDTASTSIKDFSARSAELSNVQQTHIDLESKIYKPCLNYYFSNPDGKLEREGKNNIDEAFGGEVNHSGVCQYFFD